VAYTALLQKAYRDFGFTDIIYKVATRPAKRIGSDESWDRAEQALEEALRRSNVDFSISKGEGAFYGPKIEYSLKDGIGRVWQCGTMQVDFSMPGRLGAEYVAEDNTRRTPVMLHRAIVGSFERFIGILIEHYAGAFPLWLAPHQLVVMNITERQAEYALSVKNKLVNQGFRAILDLRNEKISYKIREHSLQKLPYQVVVGDKELQAGTVAVRTRSGEDLGAMSLDAFTARLGSEMRTEAKAQ
jgi:threonyl-tRNA synthetase